MAACKAKTVYGSMGQEEKSKGRRTADHVWHPVQDQNEGLAVLTHLSHAVPKSALFLLPGRLRCLC